MLEYEKKILLTDEEYLTLLKMADKKGQPVIQTNYYYDSDNFKMNMQGITCRIREKNGKYKATIKAHNTKNRECSIEKTKDVLSERDDCLFRGMHLKLQGSLMTERLVLYSGNGCEVVLDKNTYLDMTDYELEIEYLPQSEGVAGELLYRYVSFLYPPKVGILILSERFAKSKSERFFEQKQWCVNIKKI